ncbi:MAG: radical SAM protein [Candidatus Saccharimonadales bacterium]
MDIWHKYHNGNYDVTIYRDGTKIRTFRNTPKPEVPEMIDLKITDRCDQKCPYCHENSKPNSQHGKLQQFISILLKDIYHPIELAIGGGDIFTVKNLNIFVGQLASYDFIPNLTINIESLTSARNKERLLALMNDIGSVGISGIDSYGLRGYLELYHIPRELENRFVVHHIIGLTKMQNVRDKKVLFLGYKNYGRGHNYYLKHKTEIDYNIDKARFFLSTRLNRPGYITSFDNLALEQLKVKEMVDKKVWEKCYMGDDGKFSMYIDLVKWQYARSSISPRFPLGNLTVKEAFQTLQGE